MASRPETPAPAPTWVSWFAGRIPDPVLRLRFLQAAAPPPEWTHSRRLPRLCRCALPGGLLALLAALFLLQGGDRIQPAPALCRPVARLRTAAPPAQPPEVWQVEKSGNSEVYSNGLRIDDRFAISNRRRVYLAFPREDGLSGRRRIDPAGIVFHATESLQAPFAAEQNGVLKKLGESLLEYVRRKRCYHFLIDRFGRVYRVVEETDAANHAGYSVWADNQWLYVNLNQSFLGISIEAQTHPGQEQAEMSPAQVRAAGMLTEMLRSRYRIAAANCVTHAQVSVNPGNWQIGYHTDWASGFPFAEIGLPDNYAQPLPSLWAFGFEYNPEFAHWAGSRMTSGLQLSEARLEQEAGAAGVSLRTCRWRLQRLYRERLEQVRRQSAGAAEEEGG